MESKSVVKVSKEAVNAINEVINDNKSNLSLSFISPTNFGSIGLVEIIQYLRSETDTISFSLEHKCVPTIRSFTNNLSNLLHSNEAIEIEQLGDFKEFYMAVEELCDTVPIPHILHNRNLIFYLTVPQPLTNESLQMSQKLTHMYYPNSKHWWNFYHPLFNFGKNAISMDSNLVQRFKNTKNMSFTGLSLESLLPSSGDDTLCRFIKYCLGYPLEKCQKIEEILNNIYDTSNNIDKVSKYDLIDNVNLIRYYNKLYAEHIFSLSDETKETLCKEIFKAVVKLSSNYNIGLSLSALKRLLVPIKTSNLSYEDIATLTNEYRQQDMPSYCYWNVNYPLLNFALDVMFSSDDNLKKRIALVEHELAITV